MAFSNCCAATTERQLKLPFFYTGTINSIICFPDSSNLITLARKLHCSCSQCIHKHHSHLPGLGSGKPVHQVHQVNEQLLFMCDIKRKQKQKEECTVSRVEQRLYEDLLQTERGYHHKILLFLCVTYRGNKNKKKNALSTMRNKDCVITEETHFKQKEDIIIKFLCRPLQH